MHYQIQARLPEGLLRLHVNRRLDFFFWPSRWQVFKDWVRFAILRQTIPIPPPSRRITKIDYETRTITYS